VTDAPSAGYFAHETAVVEQGALIGEDTKVWHHAHVRAGARVGARCTLGKNVYIDAGAVIGDGVKIQNNVSVYAGVTLSDGVFVGPSAVFTNDRYPRATSDGFELVPTRVGRGASIGANATIVCGADVGEWALVAAGAVVARPVEAYALVAGNPARRLGWVCPCGRVASREDEPAAADPRCKECRAAGITYP